MTTHEKVAHWYAIFNLAVIVIGGLLFLYWYELEPIFFPVMILKSNPMEIQTDKTIYHRGETIYINMSFCKLRDIPASIYWRMMDGEIILFSPIEKITPVGCYPNTKPFMTSTIVVPENAPCGVWHLEGNATFHMNPIKDITYTRKTTSFTVIP